MPVYVQRPIAIYSPGGMSLACRDSGAAVGGCCGGDGGGGEGGGCDAEAGLREPLIIISWILKCTYRHVAAFRRNATRTYKYDSEL